MVVAVNVNGSVFDKEHAVISVFDHGFLYGEGVYETLRTYGSKLFLFERHIRRLRASAEMMALPVPLTDAECRARVEATMAAARGSSAPTAGGETYIRILVTRGVGELSYDTAACPVSSVVIIVKPHADPPPVVFDRGVKVALVPIVRNHPASVNPRIKSNNLLNNALAMQEALRRGGYEGIMRNYRGELSECTQSNLFIVRDGAALTPPLDAGILPGITREFVFEVGQEAGVAVREAALRDADLYAADEAFLTSTTRELVPIVAVDEHVIGAGRPGPVTRTLLDGFRKRVAALAREC